MRGHSKVGCSRMPSPRTRGTCARTCSASRPRTLAATATRQGPPTGRRSTVICVAISIKYLYISLRYWKITDTYSVLGKSCNWDKIRGGSESGYRGVAISGCWGVGVSGSADVGILGCRNAVRTSVSRDLAMSIFGDNGILRYLTQGSHGI